MNKMMFTKFVKVVREFRQVEEEESKTFPKYWFEGNTKQVYYCKQSKRKCTGTRLKNNLHHTLVGKVTQ